MKITFRNLITFLVVAIILFFVCPRPIYSPAGWWDPIDRSVRIYQFSKYLIPSNYTFVSYMEGNQSGGPFDRKKFVIFRNKETGQQFFIFILNELPKVKFDQLDITNKKIHMVTRHYLQDIRGNTNFKLRYIVPDFLRKDYSEEFPNAEIRGLKLESKDQFETEKTDILVFRGKFNDLGFYRKSDSQLFKYPAPIFHSDQRMKGDIALINNKSTGETIFAFGCIGDNQNFNENEFLEMIKSVSFDKQPKALFGHA